MSEEPLVRLKWQASTWFALSIAGFLLSLTALLSYAWYRNAQLDAQQPIVETCVKHRVNQEVLVR